MSDHYHESISCERPERFAHIHGIVKAAWCRIDAVGGRAHGH